MLIANQVSSIQILNNNLIFLNKKKLIITKQNFGLKKFNNKEIILFLKI